MNIHTFFLAFILLTTFTGGECVAQSLQATDSHRDAAALSKEAYELILKNDYAAAIAKAELAIRKDPDLGEAHKNLALAYCDSGQVEAALGPAQRAVKLSPNFDKAHHVLGKILFKLGSFSEAITQFQEAIRINPKYDKAYFFLGWSYDLSNKPENARIALDQAVQLKPDDIFYRGLRDFVTAYARQQKDQTIPGIVPIEGRTDEYAAVVYGGIFYQALMHRDYNLIDKAADAARASKEKLPGGLWKLHYIYGQLNRPFTYTSDYDWNQHLDLLKQWTREKPNSVTAKVALASGYVAFAWYIRGGGFARTVPAANWKWFYERLARARDILLSVQPDCPKWYSVMQAIALGQGWDKPSYEKLFKGAVQDEPTWYEYYGQKAVFLLPRWHGGPGEMEAYVNSLAATQDTDNAIRYFLVNRFVGSYDKYDKFRPVTSYPVFKRGFIELQKTHGATAYDVNWACFKALLSQDRSFARELLSQLDQPDLQVWGTKQAFDGAKIFVEAK
jgi:tetratricopeptide (TPR) repeat protein